ncbi:hypothetical protein V8F33_009853 [Rhypophila sp. PSN 637]
MAQFKDLEAVILVRIMGHLWRFLDLLSFIHVCKCTRAAFETSEPQVMWDFLRRFYGINLYEAIHLVTDLPEFDANFDYRPNQNQVAGGIQESIWSRKVREFSPGFLSATYRDRDRFGAAWIARQYSGPLVIRLGRLSTVLDGLLGQYWEFVQDVVVEQDIPLCGYSAGLPEAVNHWHRAGIFASAPSPAERHRLVRAFLRYEIMCRLFSIPYWKILCCVSWTHMDFAAKKAVLAVYARHDWSSDHFMRLMDKGEAEQVLCVGAFVRAQWRAMLTELRSTFEGNAHNRCATFEANGPKDEDEVVTLLEHLSTDIRVKENPVYSCDYMLGRPSSKETIWIDNLAAGFGLGLLRKSLQAGPADQRKGLRAIIAACHSEPQTLDKASGYRPNFIHTRSFPVVNPPDKDDTEDYDKAKMRLVGYHLWDNSRLYTPEMLKLEAWLNAPSVLPFEPGSKEQNTPWHSFTSMKLPFSDYHKLARHVWVEKFSDLGDVSPERYRKILSVLTSSHIDNILDMQYQDDPPAEETTSQPAEAPTQENEAPST